MNATSANTTSVAALLESADGAIAAAWSVVVEWSGGEEGGDYFRLCILPTLGSICLFWLLNVPLLFFNFVPSLNPLEQWKVQKGRYESKERVCWMLALVVLNQAIAMGISAAPQNYAAVKGQGVLSGNTGVPTLLDLAWQIPSCCMLYDALYAFPGSNRRPPTCARSADCCPVPGPAGTASSPYTA